MEEIIIYGCGNMGMLAYSYLKNSTDIKFFVDGDKDKWGSTYEGIDVKPPRELENNPNAKVVIASMQYNEIIKDLHEMGIDNLNCEIFKLEMEKILPINVESELDKRTIDLGDFLIKSNHSLTCKELSFMTGGSGVLDYFFIKEIVIRGGCKGYLEIGTYIGESINILTECCNKLISVTAEPESTYGMKHWCECAKIPDYSERLAYDKKIEHYYGDSKEFNFSAHSRDIDLYFVDGDHSYCGVYADTKNIFKVKKKDAIVIWHDFKLARNKYNSNVVMAVKDVLGKEFENVYVTTNNICGIYIPPNIRYKFDFILRERKYEENAPLYTYDVVLQNLGIK